MPNVTNHQGDANQTHDEVAPRTCRNDYHCKDEDAVHCWWHCELVQPPRKTVRRVLGKLEVRLPQDPAIAVPGFQPKETETLTRKVTWATKFAAA